MLLIKKRPVAIRNFDSIVFKINMNTDSEIFKCIIVLSKEIKEKG